jgi:transcriptional regulator with GAF, ATPase, and Fis domain
VESLKRSLRRREDEVRIVAESGAMKKIMELAGKVAAGESTILITGESGTGKEVIARHIHRLSPRDSSEFVAVDCSALVEGLIESELFGHVRGAFTGAWRSSRGSLELADGGTLFFDEVSNLSLPVQSKILRTIQEREIRRIGDPRPISVDLRIIAATNRDLREAVEAGVFREDLFYRLNVFPITMPPLRERSEDILPLAGEFLRIFTRRKRKEIEGFDEGSRKFLLSYGWPGNVRELQNVIDRAVTVEEGGRITLGAMLIEPLSWPKKGAASSGEPAGEGFDSTLLRDAEARHIGKVLEAAAWNKGKAARLLGIDKKTLVSKIKRYNLQKEKA